MSFRRSATFLVGTGSNDWARAVSSMARGGIDQVISVFNSRKITADMAAAAGTVTIHAATIVMK